MVSTTDLYAATRDGLDIILYYYPQAAPSVENPHKKFKRRPDEDDASASLKHYKECWKVTDFGDSGTAMSPVDICMSEENLRFTEAVALLAARHGVSGTLSKAVNKPDIRKRPATPDEAEGARFFELEEKWTEAQLAVMGPRVKQEHVDALHWHVARSISYVKNREVTTKYTTDTYPIFMRQCAVHRPDGTDEYFYKIYEPLNPDKQWRFSYTPEGVKPKVYINGLDELIRAYTDYNEKEERLFYSDPANEDKPYRTQKLDEAFICSGERDALCIRALGYQPLWFNSETYKVTADEIKEISKYVNRLYNIPDIDATGIRKGTELALRFLDVYTVWLPAWLPAYRDRRGKPRKDFRDWVEMRPSQADFRNLLQLAMPARFWEEKITKSGRSYEINTSFMHHFLTLNGFYTLKDDNTDSARYIRLQGAVVQPVKTKDISTFLRRTATERYLPVEIRNLILNSPRTGESTLSQLDEIELDFKSYTEYTQKLFFQNETWTVSPDGIDRHSGALPDGKVVWQDKVIPHRVSRLEPMFQVQRTTDAEGGLHFDISIRPDHGSPFFCYLINTSRTHWRKELEYLWEDRDFHEAEAYRAAHRFDIAGPLLSEEEIQEQKANLVNKIFTIGYHLHRHKSPSRSWAAFAMDNKIGEDDECNGRSGKSFFFKALGNFLNVVPLSGRDQRVMDNAHVFERVDQHTDLVFVDDCDRYFPIKRLYDSISAGLTINPKNNRSFFLPYEEAPKFAFSTNYVPRDFDASTNARMLYLVFSDYYHEQTAENDYLETRSIRDDFGRELMTANGYTDADWDADFNFFGQCLQFYLSMMKMGIKIQPPMHNIMMRKYKADMGSGFEDWAMSYFAEDGEHVNVMLRRDNLLKEFLEGTGVNKNYWTMQRFTKALHGFEQLCPYVVAVNPPELCNAQGRLQRKVDGATRDMIYVQTAGQPVLNLDVQPADEVPF